MDSPESVQWIESPEEVRRIKAMREIMDRLDLLTPKQKFQTLIDSGIYTQDGRLRKEYGGKA